MSAIAFLFEQIREALMQSAQRLKLFGGYSVIYASLRDF